MADAPRPAVAGVLSVILRNLTTSSHHKRTQLFRTPADTETPLQTVLNSQSYSGSPRHLANIPGKSRGSVSQFAEGRGLTPSEIEGVRLTCHRVVEMRTAGFEDKHLLRRVLGKPGSNDETSGSATDDDEVECFSGDLVNRCESGTHGGCGRRRREVILRLAAHVQAFYR